MVIIKKFNFINESFICENCGEEVKPLKNGSCRNHCPSCLYSKHLDINPGDRRNDCKGLMEPIDFLVSTDLIKVVHKCTKCNQTKVNKLALDDPIQPDNYDYVLNLMEERQFKK